MTIVAGRLARDVRDMDPVAIGKRIRAARESLPSVKSQGQPLTQDELGELIGVKGNTVSRWERAWEGSTPSRGKLAAIATALGTTVEWLERDERSRDAPNVVQESRIEYDPDAFVEPSLVKRVAHDVGLDREKTDRLLDMRWSIGLPSEVTLRSYAVDLARGGPKLPDGSAPDEPRAEAIMDIVGEARARRS